ncbi:hypothetical protein ABER23_13250 [Paenibacillus lautus]|uniref:hypothetical protein n=1 Tax=Paenibacillus lautus TaxID=1401 RepID=UPI003D2AB0F5
MLIYYEVECFCCKKTFRLYEGSTGYKNFKENRKGNYSCESCNHSIRLEAIFNLLRK